MFTVYYKCGKWAGQVRTYQTAGRMGNMIHRYFCTIYGYEKGKKMHNRFFHWADKAEADRKDRSLTVAETLRCEYTTV